MEDPFSALLCSLQIVFHLEAMRNDRYTYPAVQQLRDSCDCYDPHSKNSFIELLKALREALPHIEKWHADFKMIRQAMDALAKIHRLPRIEWDKVLAHPKVSPKFQFSALNHSLSETDLLAWLTSKTGKPFAQLDHHKLTQALVDHKNRHGMSQKLSNHLKKDPDFLFILIMKSEKNFIKIVQTRLILYLTDQQIAKALLQHVPIFVNKRKEPFAQVESLIHKINDLLSNGRSVSTLLRNSEAKTILDNSPFFQIYQSDEYQSRHQKPPQRPEEAWKFRI